MPIHRSSMVAVVATVLLLTPMVSAWSSYGSYEPDTIYDTTDYMWDMPGPATADHVYFNAFTATQATVNPNVGALETANEAPNAERPMAILGVWVDCNQDGYVGHIESALYEYSSALLLDDNVCPPVTGDADNWTAGAHNYNGWVTELVTIGRPTTNDAEDGPSDARVYVDPLAKIWADLGLPETELAGTGGGSCALNPFPRGTMQSTSGFLNYLDCNVDIMGRWNTVMDAGGDPLGLRFENDDDASGHAIDMPTFGSDDSSHAAASVFDCSADPVLESGALVNDSPAYAPMTDAETTAEDVWGDNLVNLWAAYDQTVLTPNPRTLDGEDPTAPGQLNQTNEELDDCDTSNDNGQDFYGLLNEGDNVGNGGTVGKTSSDWDFAYFEGTRGIRVATDEATIEDQTIPEVIIREDGATGPFLDLGSAAGRGIFGSSWFGTVNAIKVPATIVARADAENPGADIAPGYIITYYAYVSPVITGSFVTPGGIGVYGAPICGDAEEGIIGGWNCDPAQWNLNPDGTVEAGADFLPFVHDTYTLRDIDCYDGGNNLGVGTGLPAYGNEPCQRPA